MDLIADKKRLNGTVSHSSMNVLTSGLSTQTSHQGGVTSAKQTREISMNAGVMHNMEQEMLRSVVVDGVEMDVKSIEPNRHVEPIAKLLQRIDDTDLIKAHNHYAQLLDQSNQEILSRMRHRADMLRRRANQLDEEADAFERTTDNVINSNRSMIEDIEEIEDILRSLAHIEPQRV